MWVKLSASSSAVGLVLDTERSGFPYASPDGSKAQGPGGPTNVPCSTGQGFYAGPSAFFIHSATPVPHMGCSQHLSLTSALPPIWTGSIQLRLTYFCVKIGYLNQTHLVYLGTPAAWAPWEKHHKKSGHGALATMWQEFLISCTVTVIYCIRLTRPQRVVNTSKLKVLYRS